MAQNEVLYRGFVQQEIHGTTTMVLCIQMSGVATVELLQGLIRQLMREQASAIIEKAKQKLKNSETWFLGKKVLYSSMTFFNSNPWQEAPQEYFHLCMEGKCGGRWQKRAKWQPD